MPQWLIPVMLVKLSMLADETNSDILGNVLAIVPKGFVYVYDCNLHVDITSPFEPGNIH